MWDHLSNVFSVCEKATIPNQQDDDCQFIHMSSHTAVGTNLFLNVWKKASLRQRLICGNESKIGLIALPLLKIISAHIAHMSNSSQTNGETSPHFAPHTQIIVSAMLDAKRPVLSPDALQRLSARVGVNTHFKTRATISLGRYIRTMKFTLIKSPNPEKKWRGVFTDEDGKETHIDFGQSKATDYTLSKDKLRRDRYLTRHRSRENWNDPKSAGALSRWILWNTPSFERNLSHFKQRFNLK